MSFGDKLKESIISNAAEGLALSLTAILIWVSTKVGPVIMPALESNLSKSILVSLLFASLALNLVFLIIFWVIYKKPQFKLKYGIYWDSDKNPHCPNCKIPIAAYGSYQGSKGYYCKPCKKVFTLQDASGNDIEPQQAISEL
jgi:transposase-like protein